MTESLWQEIGKFLAEGKAEPGLYRLPLWINLTPNGKTLIIIYPGEHQEEIAEAFINKLGEPELTGSSEEHPENLCLLFPHQNLPEEVKDIAERMTTANLLRSLRMEV